VQTELRWQNLEGKGSEDGDGGTKWEDGVEMEKVSVSVVLEGESLGLVTKVVISSCGHSQRQSLSEQVEGVYENDAEAIALAEVARDLSA
jgi:hypothetical protein